MKTKRFKYGYRKSASALHKKVGDCIRASTTFSAYPIYQEYPVNKINSDYKSGREKFDWVINNLKIIIECHGEQHYKPATFGGITKELAEKRFKAQLKRDEAKKQAALDAGYTYIVVPHYDEDKVSEEFILNLVKLNVNHQLSTVSEPEKTTDWKTLYAEKKRREEESGEAEERRERSRALAQARYRSQKQWLSSLKGGKK